MKQRILWLVLLLTLSASAQQVNRKGGGACPTLNGNAGTFCNGTGAFSQPPIGATVPGYTVNGLQSGGGVSWISGYSFNVSAATYTIAGASYSSPETTVTLAAADATLDRIDVIAVNSSGAVVVVAGTLAATPVKPEVDFSNQLELTFITVTHNTTQPVSVTTTDIYHENTEWTTSKTGNPINLASTNNPHAGTVDIEATATVSGNLFQFTVPASGTIDLGTRTNLVFYIRSKAAWTAGQGLNLAWYNGTTKKGSSVILTSGQFGFSSSTTTAYQQVVIPLSLFAINGTALTSLKATIQGTGSFGFYMDDVTLQGGSAATPTPAVSAYAASKSLLIMKDDFCGGNSATGNSQNNLNGGIGELGWFFVQNSAVLTFPQQSFDNHPCVIDLAVNGSNNWVWLGLGATNTAAAINRIDTITFDQHWIFQTPSVTGDGKIRAGFTADSGSQDPANGVYFELSFLSGAGTWHCVTRKTSTETSASSGVASSLTLWNDYEITGDGSGTITFLINGSQVCSQNTNVPVIPVTPAIEHQEVTANPSAGRNVLLDYFWMSMPTTR